MGRWPARDADLIARGADEEPEHVRRVRCEGRRYAREVSAERLVMMGGEEQGTQRPVTPDDGDVDEIGGKAESRSGIAVGCMASEREA